MGLRRLIYLTTLAGCFVLYLAYGQWLAWIILLWVIAMPFLSLLLSILPMVSFRIIPTGPDTLSMGEEADYWLLGTCAYPMPPFRGQLSLKHCFTGKKYPYPVKELTAHCGSYLLTAEKVRIHDYLGLFSFPVWKKESKLLRIRPRPVPYPVSADLRQRVIRRWKNKAGGGFSEHHELRLYRPGDKLNQVHWKLSAKTGQLMLRQPMEPQQEGILLTVNLRGAPEELDRKLGRLLWLGNHLLERELFFDIRALTGNGIHHFPVSGQQALENALDTLLCQPLTDEGDIRQLEYAAFRRFHMGGQPDEA